MFSRIKRSLADRRRRDPVSSPAPSGGHHGRPDGVAIEAAVPPVPSPGMSRPLHRTLNKFPLIHSEATVDIEPHPTKPILAVTESGPPAPSRNASEDGASDATSLWGQAFIQLEENHGTLVAEYEELLLRELSSTSGFFNDHFV